MAAVSGRAVARVVAMRLRLDTVDSQHRDALTVCFEKALSL